MLYRKVSASYENVLFIINYYKVILSLRAFHHLRYMIDD